MNQKFFNLSKEKQKTIIDAGYRVFSENKYKKSPMSEIATEAGISKALLFHYFDNKKEFYLYLYDYGVKLVLDIMQKDITFKEKDFFKVYLQGMKYKIHVFKRHQYLFNFMIRAYYEDEIEIAKEIEKRNKYMLNYADDNFFNELELYKFKEEIEIKELSKMITWCGEGYIKDKCKTYPLDLDELETGFKKILDFFRKNSYKEEYLK